MRVKNGDIWQANTALVALTKAVWPVKTAYQLAQLRRRVTEAHRDISQVKDDLVKRHGQPNERGRLEIQAGMPGWGEFVAAMNELLAEETEIDVEPVVLPTSDGYQVESEALMLCYPFVIVAD